MTLLWSAAKAVMSWFKLLLWGGGSVVGLLDWPGRLVVARVSSGPDWPGRLPSHSQGFCDWHHGEWNKHTAEDRRGRTEDREDQTTEDRETPRDLTWTQPHGHLQQGGRGHQSRSLHWRTEWASGQGITLASMPCLTGGKGRQARKGWLVLRCIRPPKSHSGTNNFLKISVCAD